MSRSNSRPPKRMGHGPMMGATEKAKNFKGTMRQLIAYMRPYYVKISLAMLFAVAGTIFMIVGPKILGKATTALAQGFMEKVTGVGGIDFDYILSIILFLLGLYVLSGLFSFVQQYVMSGVTQRTAYDLRKKIAEKIDRMPFKYFDTNSHGDVLSRVTNDIDTLAQSLNQSLNTLITSIVNIIGFTVMMLSISWQMTLVAFVTVPLSVVFVSTIVKKSQKYFVSQQKFLGEVNGHIEEMYGGHTVMKAFNGEERSVEVFEKHNHKLYHVGWKSQFLSGLMQPIIGFVGNIGYVFVCILGGWLAIQGTIEIGDIQAFIQYVRNFNQPITQMAQVMNMLQSTAAAAERVFEFLQEEEELPETENPVEIYDENGNCRIEGQVTFENVRFGYDPNKIIIHDFSMYIKPGKKIAIVGPTGAGKTTIVKLLMRFYELNSGTIYIDGIKTTEMRRADLRSLFGMVLQDAWLFHGSIIDNLRYGKLDATDEEVMKAADAAFVDHFIRTLDHGYQTEINEDSNNISQGQKQLLTIARAFLADPKILILDEATSSVDTRTEVLIQKGMQKLMENRTSFVIAHRLSTIRDADLILVMKDGDIVEAGNHDELMQEQGFYTQLYNSQFEEA
ncbi:MAG: ABC transporter ATP-binding protein [Erysipelotrichaceae bacterium]|nr:ABC transporter ATP-binding protein [Erysipelotrichaceae bacterium]MCI9524306.1 ABC transporter ATP-binding protein [Erysipelotrichaceae bacterium]